MAVLELRVGNRLQDNSFDSSSVAAVQQNWSLSNSAEFSSDVGADLIPFTYSLKCLTTRTAAGWNVAGQRIAVTPSTSYSYRARIKQTAGAKQTHFKITYYKSD